MNKIEPPYRPLNIIGDFLIPPISPSSGTIIRHKSVNEFYCEVSSNNDMKSIVTLGVNHDNLFCILFVSPQMSYENAKLYQEKLLQNVAHQLASSDKY